MNISPLKIIWNITNKCGYNCDICATNSDRDELDLLGKQKAYAALRTIGSHNICEIDFSGGDPLCDKSSLIVIHEAIAELGKKKISITTTGKGINVALGSGEDLSELLTNCEITMDALENGDDSIRNDATYGISNKNAIGIIEKYASNLTINVPIIDPSVDEARIRLFIKEIDKINVPRKSVNLIRLMQVGRMGAERTVPFENPNDFAGLFSEYAVESSIDSVHVHCALRGKIMDSKCNMLLEKIGVDCSGNVFACAWGGYITGYCKDNITDNPFYLGNLLEASLYDIINGCRAKDMRQRIEDHPTSHCRVYCYHSKDPYSIFVDSDPLFE